MTFDFDPSSVLGWIALVVAVVFGARSGIYRTTVAAQKEQIDAYEAREKKHQEDLDRLLGERQAKDEQTDAALKRLGERNTVLEELVLKKAETAEIVAVMRDHDHEAAARHAATIRQLREITQNQKERAEQEKEIFEQMKSLSVQLSEQMGDGNA